MTIMLRTIEMSRPNNFRNTERGRTRSGLEQPVYDPTYVYAPWKKWVVIGIIALIVSALTYGIIAAQQGRGSQEVVANSTAPTPQTTVPQEAAQQQDSPLYKVVKVIDGDTLDVSIDGKTERLRLIGIDTPETVDPRETVQCFGKEASDKAKSMLQGTSVHLEEDTSQDSRDKYGRLLRYVYLEDGTNFNKYMIAEGYAHEYTYQVPYAYQKEFKAAEASARDNNRGLWSPSSCGGVTTSDAPAQPAPKATPAPTAPSGNCDPNYSPCVPLVSYDLDCGDISTSVKVIGTDIHRFDREGDGYGCESN
jgi:micrococcal nuclease